MPRIQALILLLGVFGNCNADSCFKFGPSSDACIVAKPEKTFTAACPTGHFIYKVDHTYGDSPHYTTLLNSIILQVTFMCSDGSTLGPFPPVANADTGMYCPEPFTEQSLSDTGFASVEERGCFVHDLNFKSSRSPAVDYPRSYDHEFNCNGEERVSSVTLEYSNILTDWTVCCSLPKPGIIVRSTAPAPFPPPAAAFPLGITVGAACGAVGLAVLAVLAAVWIKRRSRKVGAECAVESTADDMADDKAAPPVSIRIGDVQGAKLDGTRVGEVSAAQPAAGATLQPSDTGAAVKDDDSLDNAVQVKE